MIAFTLVLSGCTGYGTVTSGTADVIDARIVGQLSELEQISGTVTEKLNRAFIDWNCRRMSIREWTIVWSSRVELWQTLCATPSDLPLIPRNDLRAFK